MSPLLIIVVVLALLAIFAQFGGALRASNALSWWLTAAFLAVAVVSPYTLTPLAHWLGIELVSNLVLAALIFFLYLKVLVLSATTTEASRKLRDLTSEPPPATFDRR